jgi:hypothetical protein
LVTVIPTWAPDSWVDSERSAFCRPRALDLSAVDGDERELGRDEHPARRDECEREREQQE